MKFTNDSKSEEKRIGLSSLTGLSESTLHFDAVNISRLKGKSYYEALVEIEKEYWGRHEAEKI